MGGSQNYGPLLGTLNIKCRIIIGTQKGTIILTTTHVRSFKSQVSERMLKYQVADWLSVLRIPWRYRI